MKALTPALRFDPARRLYSLVISYLAQVHGFLELASRASRNMAEDLSPEHKAAVVARIDYESSKPFIVKNLSGGKTELIGQAKLAARSGPGIAIDTDVLAREFLDNPDQSLRNVNLATGGNLLILAWEITSDAHSKDPMWEFLRHCRNAAAHTGTFTLRGKEPTYPAAWRSFVIDRSLEGTPLFIDPPQHPGLLGGGDVLYLLADIEQAFPNA